MTNRKPAVDDPVPDDPVGLSRPNQFRYNYAKHDPAHCTAKGLFQPLKRAERKKQEHTVLHKYGDVTLEFKCSEPLGADDLRVLQGLLALASPIADPEVLTANTPPENQKLRDSLKLSESANHLETLVVQATRYQLAKEIGLTLSGSTFPRIKASIIRMCSVSILATDKDGRRTGYNLIGGYSSQANEALIRVALNPRLTAAILGELTGDPINHAALAIATACSRDVAPAGRGNNLSSSFIAKLFPTKGFRSGRNPIPANRAVRSGGQARGDINPRGTTDCLPAPRFMPRWA